jgi:hypothetical protein
MSFCAPVIYDSNEPLRLASGAATVVPEQNPLLMTEKRRLRFGYIGLGVYFLIFLNAIRLAPHLPLPVFVCGALINAAIVTVFVLELRKTHQKIRSLQPKT